MRCLTLSRLATSLLLAIALAPRPAGAQQSDTLSISGTFTPTSLYALNGTTYAGTGGGELADVFATGHAYTWTLTLQGLSYSHDYAFTDMSTYYLSSFDKRYITRVYATSLNIEFFGPDADILNQVVSSQLTNGNGVDDTVLELVNGNYYDSSDPFGSGPYTTFEISLRPSDPSAGVFYWVFGVPDIITPSEYPVVEPEPGYVLYASITDLRPGNAGVLASYLDRVNIGSVVPPDFPPPPPPPPPTLSIADALVREGNKGTTRLNLAVTLSRGTTDTVTVHYATSDGAAQKKSDYTATSGTLTFQPGQTSRTISVAIKGERKREPNETFTVQLSNAVAATIGDGSATVTILNDD